MGIKRITRAKDKRMPWMIRWNNTFYGKLRISSFSVMQGASG